ncbi:MogA/MoaB family molybdenum cofactor biosynthesis protein [Heyndrickxia oleronia]|uniref:MogA/MoaB family molybdenum cofactor biosynthesis protein n=1 Tax=Heyndrickxia oleronia TaxID=38875 RepID=UPI001B036B63|nr:MogA/MoaB family molybdenum cofactor biosynthesis protein [Heyndrickxia oleronia]GIN38756.1 molybdenum cofactor biosynthesis protein B [Heyndrickxia oleronia]
MSVTKHKEDGTRKVSCGVITVSDTRTTETDRSGKLMMDLLTTKGHRVHDYRIVIDQGAQILEAVENMSENNHIEVILINGGTGIAIRDVTIESLSPLFDKELTGFGELFRYLSYTEDIGSAAMLSRATAGVYKNKIIFITPGSTGAVKLAMTKLIIPELPHIIHELAKDIR